MTNSAATSLRGPNTVSLEFWSRNVFIIYYWTQMEQIRTIVKHRIRWNKNIFVMKHLMLAAAAIKNCNTSPEIIHSIRKRWYMTILKLLKLIGNWVDSARRWFMYCTLCNTLAYILRFHCWQFLFFIFRYYLYFLVIIVIRRKKYSS